MIAYATLRHGADGPGRVVQKQMWVRGHLATFKSGQIVHFPGEEPCSDVVSFLPGFPRRRSEMKKIAWFVPVLIATPMALAVACGGPAEMDGTGGTDGGTGGNDPTGGSSNDGTGGSSDGTGGSSDGSGGSTGGSDVGGMGGMGGSDACSAPSDEEVGMGGFGGGSSELTELCQIRCSHATACGAAGCDEEACVTACADTYPTYYYYNCLAEYTALKACEVENLTGDDYTCDPAYDSVFALPSGTAKCEAEDEAFNDCYF